MTDMAKKHHCPNCSKHLVVRVRPETVVDYEAWERGYMPPSEHVLIDQLAYRGARVALGMDFGDLAFWVVVRGKMPTAAVRCKLMEMLNTAMDETSSATSSERGMTVISKRPSSGAGHCT